MMINLLRNGFSLREYRLIRAFGGMAAASEAFKKNADKAKTEAEFKGKEGKEGKEKKEQAAEKLKSGPDKAAQERIKKADQQVEDAIKQLIAAEVMRFGPQHQKKMEAYIRKRIGNPNDPLAKHFRDMREKLMSAPTKEDAQKKQQAVEKREVSDQEKALVDSFRTLIEALVLLLQNWAGAGREKGDKVQKGKEKADKEKKGKEGGVEAKTDQQIKQEISKELEAGRSVADLQKETVGRIAKLGMERQSVQDNLASEEKAEAALRKQIAEALDEKTRTSLKKQLDEGQAKIGKLKEQIAKIEGDRKSLQDRKDILERLGTFGKGAEETMKKLQTEVGRKAAVEGLDQHAQIAFEGMAISFRMHGGDLVPVIAPRPGQRGLALALIRIIQEDVRASGGSRGDYMTLQEARFFLEHPNYIDRALRKLRELNVTALDKRLEEATHTLEEQVGKTRDPQSKEVTSAREALTKVLEDSTDHYITKRLEALHTYVRSGEELQKVVNGIRISVNLKSRQVRTERMGG